MYVLTLQNSVVAQIRQGPRLQKVIQGVLTVGNAVNVGTAYGNAQGLKLDSLLKLADVKVCSLCQGLTPLCLHVVHSSCILMIKGLVPSIGPTYLTLLPDLHTAHCT